MKQFPDHYPNINGFSAERAFEFSHNNKPIADIRYCIPKKIESKKDDDYKIDSDDPEWGDQCEFPLYEMPSNVKFEDKYRGVRSGSGEALEIEVFSEIVSVESLGIVTNSAHLLNAAKMYLMRRYGFFAKYFPQPVTILADTSITRSLNAIKYVIKHRDFGKDNIGYFFYLGSHHMLHLHFSFAERDYESYKSYRDYTLALTDNIVQSLKITLHTPPIQAESFIVGQEETMTWKEYSIPSRYELERRLLLDGLVSQKDCYYTFDEASLKADWIVLGGDDKKNFLSKDVLVPSLDFKKIDKKISVPKSRYPENPVEVELMRLVEEKSKLLKVFLRSLENAVSA